MGIPLQVTFDASSPARLAAFWQVALGYELDAPPPGFATWGEALASFGLDPESDDASGIHDPAGKGPRLYFQKVPEGKTAKNRVHVDVNIGQGIADDDARWSAVLEHVDRLTGAGGTVIEHRSNDFGERWVVPADPDGNEFCVQ